MVLFEVLAALRSQGVAGPGDLVAKTGMPRYLVLSTFKCLEELGLVELVYSKGTHRAYRLSTLGLRVLDSGVGSLADLIEAGLTSIEASVSGVAGRQAGAAEVGAG